MRNQTYRLMICRNLFPAAEPIVKYLWLLLLFVADELISAADNTMSPRSLGFRPFDRMLVVVVVTWWFIANHRRLSTFSIVLEILLLLSFVVLLSSSSLSNRSTTVSISAVWVWVSVWVRFVKSSSSFFSSFFVINEFKYWLI